MPSPVTRLSVVLPVRDGQSDIARRVLNVLEAIADMTREASEVVVVDDGSKDATPEVLDELKSRYPQVRVVRHGRPRGLEAAGQTGLEKATGELVFIQETDLAVRLEDMRRLLQMSEDRSVVAARAESTPSSPFASLDAATTCLGNQRGPTGRRGGGKNRKIEPSNDSTSAFTDAGRSQREIAIDCKVRPSIPRRWKTP